MKKWPEDLVEVCLQQSKLIRCGPGEDLIAVRCGMVGCNYEFIVHCV